jgi:2',3'-cyclic-nucleotide 2'-phosphodiesterase (5'-nucleotidase family)
MNVCRFCGCTESQARADAMVLGLNEEFERGLYSCCQLVTWADEQWLAWTEAASEDGKALDEVTKPIEIHEAEREPVLVRVRSGRQQGNRSLPWFG